MHHKCQCLKHLGVLMDKKHLFSRLLKKAVSMALWTKASLCVKSSLLEQSLSRTPSRPKTSIISVNPVILSNLSSCSSCASWLKNPFNPRNLRLINDLRSTKVYVRKNNLFMQNKANSNPNKPNFKPGLLSVREIASVCMA